MHHLAALSLLDPRDNSGSPPKAFILREVIEGAVCSEARVARSEDNCTDSSETYRTRAHRARLNGHAQNRLRKAPITGRLTRSANRQNLRVGGGIGPPLHRIVSAGDYSAPHAYDGADRNLFRPPSKICFLESGVHKTLDKLRVDFHRFSGLRPMTKEKVAHPKRFELLTFWFVARRSIQLS